MRSKKKKPFEPLNFDNKGNLFYNEIVNTLTRPHNGKDTTTYRTTLFGTYEEVTQKCFCCDIVKPMSMFPTRSEKRINYLTMGLTESWCRDCWNNKDRLKYNKPKTKYEGATLEALFE